MATRVDDDDYAHVVLICSGQFSDPDLECRLADITRQLHMLAAGYLQFYCLVFIAFEFGCLSFVWMAHTLLLD